MKEILLIGITGFSGLFMIIFLLFNGMPYGNVEIFLFSIISLMFVASLVGCLIAIIRMYCSPINGDLIPTTPTPINILSDPPPIGSVQAEFQNDYISVFPMHNLHKKAPDLDLT